tara:strand:+ start:261 stop:569 length:309 start_codon:yes stop_codon:yes gene_type:complete
MKIHVDIDETICYYKGDRNYEDALPILSRIEKINKMYDEGHEITYWTARGTVTGIDWTETTVMQLKKWGAKYNRVMLGKPDFDLYICDKAMNSEIFFVGEER